MDDFPGKPETMAVRSAFPKKTDGDSPKMITL
jgi:hypothetical protein